VRKAYDHAGDAAARSYRVECRPYPSCVRRSRLPLVTRGSLDVPPMLREVHTSRAGLRARDDPWNEVRGLILELTSSV
jgi:hypothetical protein